MARRLARITLLAAGIAVGWPAVLGGGEPGGGSLARPVCVNAAAQHHAAVVVEHADGSRVRTACVGFDGANVTGKQALVASGIEYGFSSNPNYGDAVCQVDNEPASYPPNCFSLPDYWSIWQAGYGQAWTYASKGVDGVSLGDGDAIGFRYEPQPPAPQVAPSSPVGICPPPQPKSTPSSASSPATAPSATAGTSAGRAAIASPSPVGATPSAVPSATTDTAKGSARARAPTGPSIGNPNRGTPLATRTAAAPKPSIGWVAAAVAALLLVGMLAVQLLAGRGWD
jgi:hypothetical protein